MDEELKIIWIDGQFGVGKTATANLIVQKKDQAYLLEFDTLQKTYKPQTEIEMISAFFGPTYPEAKAYLIKEFKRTIQKIVSDNRYNYLVIPIALINDLCRKELVEFYTDIDNYHFILTATDDVIKHRASNQDNRDMNLVLTHMQTAKMYLNTHYPDAVRIDTSNIGIDQVAEKIIEIID